MIGNRDPVADMTEAVHRTLDLREPEEREDQQRICLAKTARHKPGELREF